MTQTIAVTTTHPYFGGVRLWFCCPQTGERARMLFLAPGRRQWASRTALGIAYASQRMGPSERRLNRLIHHVNASERRSAIRRLRRSGTCT